jgi:hypothetical protein
LACDNDNVAINEPEVGANEGGDIESGERREQKSAVVS